MIEGPLKRVETAEYDTKHPLFGMDGSNWKKKRDGLVERMSGFASLDPLSQARLDLARSASSFEDFAASEVAFYEADGEAVLGDFLAPESGGVHIRDGDFWIRIARIKSSSGPNIIELEVSERTDDVFRGVIYRERWSFVSSFAMAASFALEKASSVIEDRMYDEVQEEINSMVEGAE